VLRTIEGNFLHGMSRPAAVVLTARNWETGALEDWIAYSVQPSYSSTFEDVARLGSQLATWVWLLAGFSLLVVFLDAAGVWVCIRLGGSIATAIDDLSGAARQIAGGNFAWRMPVRHKDQLGDLICDFNDMAIAWNGFTRRRLRLEGSRANFRRSVAFRSICTYAWFPGCMGRPWQAARWLRERSAPTSTTFSIWVRSELGSFART